MFNIVKLLQKKEEFTLSLVGINYDQTINSYYAFSCSSCDGSCQSNCQGDCYGACENGCDSGQMNISEI